MKLGHQQVRQTWRGGEEFLSVGVLKGGRKTIGVGKPCSDNLAGFITSTHNP